MFAMNPFSQIKACLISNVRVGTVGHVTLKSIFIN